MNRTQRILVYIYVIAVVTLIVLTSVYQTAEPTELTHRVVIVATVAILMTLLLAVVLLYASNRRLKDANQKLFEKAMEDLEYRKKAKIVRADFEHKIEDLTKKLSEREVTARQKYENSSLDEEDKRVIIDKIIAMMEGSDEIFSTEFSLNRLAELVGSNYKHVSQVINETGGQNFSSMLSEYRIKEACRRLTDQENYSSYTIEAVAESVGFKSRSNFVNTFKRITGITPSQFQRMAIDHRKDE